MIVHEKGMHIFLRDRCLKQDYSILQDIFTRDGYHCHELVQRIPHPKLILDIGGHIGIFGLLASYHWPGVKIMAFEPNPESYRVYKKNIDINHLDSIRLFNRAVTPSKEPYSVFCAQNQSTITFLATAHECAELAQGKSVEHPVYQSFNTRFGPFKKVCGLPKTISLDEIVTMIEPDSVDLLKIDCEGSETDILTHIQKNTREKIRAIIGEYHIHGGYVQFTKKVAKNFPHLKFQQEGGVVKRLARSVKKHCFKNKGMIGHFKAF